MKKFYSWYKKHITAAIFTGLILGIIQGILAAPVQKRLIRRGKSSSDVSAWADSGNFFATGDSFR